MCLNFSFSSRKLRIFFVISLSLLITRERGFRFPFLLSKLEKLFSDFFFSSRYDFFTSRQPLSLMWGQLIHVIQRVAFILGGTLNLSLQNEVEAEAAQFGDIVQVEQIFPELSGRCYPPSTLMTSPSLEIPSVPQLFELLNNIFQSYGRYHPDIYMNLDNSLEISSRFCNFLLPHQM